MLWGIWNSREAPLEFSEYEKYVKDVLQKMVEGLECQSGRITLEDVQNNSARYRVRYSVKEELSKLEKIVNVLNNENDPV